MAKDKERSVNPAAQQRKLEKSKALKKGKAEQQARRNDKLARRNPERLQGQIDELKALEQDGRIKPQEKRILEEMERDLKAIKKARETLGDKAPTFGRERQPRNDDRADGGVLGKRRWDGERKDRQRYEPSSGSDTDEDVRRIPMPKDTPPPIPREFRRPKQQSGSDQQGRPGDLPKAPQTTYESKTSYESAPQLRNLRQEAVNRFVPNVVRKKLDTVKGQGGLVEPEELDRLEQAGYGTQPSQQAPEPGQTLQAPSSLINQAQDDINAYTDAEADEEAKRLAEEEARFQAEMKRHTHMEEVEDEDL